MRLGGRLSQQDWEKGGKFVSQKRFGWRKREPERRRRECSVGGKVDRIRIG